MPEKKARKRHVHTVHHVSYSVLAAMFPMRPEHSHHLPKTKKESANIPPVLDVGAMWTNMRPRNSGATANSDDYLDNLRTKSCLPNSAKPIE